MQKYQSIEETPSTKYLLLLAADAPCNDLGSLFTAIAPPVLPASVQSPIVTGGRAEWRVNSEQRRELS